MERGVRPGLSDVVDGTQQELRDGGDEAVENASTGETEGLLVLDVELHEDVSAEFWMKGVMTYQKHAHQVITLELLGHVCLGESL